MQLLTLEEYSEKLQRSAPRVLDMLDRMESRTDSVFSVQRKHERKSYRGTATICLPDDIDAEFDPQTAAGSKVWIRCLSQGGLSFIYPKEIEARKCFVGLDLPDGKSAWFKADIVRRRAVPNEEFWEYGVAFRGRTGT